MAMRETLQRRCRASARAARVSDADFSNARFSSGNGENTLALSATLMVCGLLISMLLLTNP